MNFHIFHHGNADPAAAAILAEILKNQKIMASQIADFAAKLSTYQDAVDKATTDIATELAALNTQIAALQNSAGAISPADQALLDGIEARAQAAASKLAALDTLTPPPVPPAA